jgi:outer membrane protein assembly factor BamB
MLFCEILALIPGEVCMKAFPSRNEIKAFPFVLLALAVFAVPVMGEDWPCWRGPRLDGIVRETGLLKQWPKDGPRQLWQVKLSGGFSAVVVADGKLFTQTKEENQEVVVCMEAATGRECWRYRYDCDYSAHPTFTGGGMPSSRTGPRATPVVDGGRVYSLGATGILHCLEAKTGKKVWQQDLLKIAERTCPSHGFCGCPLVVGECVFVEMGGTNGKSIAALNKHDGSVVWQALDDPIGQATPVWVEAGSSSQIIFFTGAGAIGVTPQNGKLLWRYPWKTRFDLNIATPIYADGQVFVSSNYGSGGAVFRLGDNREPETIWKSQAMQNHISTSVLYEGYLYGFSEQRLRCVDFRTGAVKWDKIGLGKGTLVVADGRLIVLGDHGQLVLARASPTAYSEISRSQIFDKDTLTWTVPVVSGGHLFLRSQNALAAFDLSEAGKSIGD